MASQDQGIPLYNLTDHTSYRLMELPPELQTLLESDDPPTLRLENTDTAALLRAPNKTYALRQKNTSNALILLQPHVADPSTPEQGLAAISTIHETVELDTEPEVAEKKEAEKPAASKGKWHERFGRTR